MNLAESVKVAFEGLAANKVRAGLTMLGVVIGVGAVIAMIAIGQGARQQTLDSIRAMGTNVIAVVPGQARRGAVLAGMGTSQSLTMDDAEAISKRCRAVTAVAPEFRSGAQVKYRNNNTQTVIFGTTPEYFEIRNVRIEKGKAFNETDVKAMRRVGVVGPTAAANLFGNSSPVDKTVRINGINFRIVGVTAPKGGSGFMNPDDLIFVPITTAQKRVFGVDYVRAISVQVRDSSLMAEAQAQVDRVIRSNHRLGPGTNDFMILNQAEFLQTAEQTSRTFTMLLAGIAAVSLLVGGIGIMNIMLVSVTERTREIGIRKAVGARRRDILAQFLIESVVLSLSGGAVGIALGIAGARVLAQAAGWQTSVSVSSIVLAFGFAAAVGIFFGIYPARKASFLNPIDALRYE